MLSEQIELLWTAVKADLNVAECSRLFITTTHHLKVLLATNNTCRRGGKGDVPLSCMISNWVG